MRKIAVVLQLFVTLAFTLLAGCSFGNNAPPTPAPLSAANLNLIFVVSPDLAYSAPGDINPGTANLTNQSLQRSLLMATYLKHQVLGQNNVTGIYALQPMTHLQTANNYPDMAAVGYIQQFAVLNQVTLDGEGGAGSPLNTANSYPINISYASGPVPSGVAAPLIACPACQGLDFDDTEGSNAALVTAIIRANAPGFHVFSAPWETISGLLADTNKLVGNKLSLPATFVGPNYIYAVSIAPSGGASLVTYSSNLKPTSTYPVLPSPVASGACTAQTSFSIARTGGVDGAVIPAGINTNETIYMVRHAEAHPTNGWDDGNILGAGQWRALALPSALSGKISPNQVLSIDPAQATPGDAKNPGGHGFSYVRAALTIEPYAIANNLPYNLVSSFGLVAQDSPQVTSDYLFTGGRFSNQSVLLAWEHLHIPPTVDVLLSSYQNSGQMSPQWPDEDYDSIWTVRLDAQGNVTVNNSLCEGIDSAKLSVTAPQF